MALTEYTLTDQDVGRVLPITDGYLVSLSRVAPPIYETPRWNEGSRKWVAGYLELRGSNDHRDLICFDVANPVINGNLAANHSLGYRGDLIVVAVPKASQWRLTVSDVPNLRMTHGTPPTARRVAAMREAVTTPV